MINPRVTARIEQPSELRTMRVKASDVRTLEAVAVRAGERLVFFKGLCAMLHSKNVVDLKW